MSKKKCCGFKLWFAHTVLYGIPLAVLAGLVYGAFFCGTTNYDNPYGVYVLLARIFLGVAFVIGGTCVMGIASDYIDRNCK